VSGSLSVSTFQILEKYWGYSSFRPLQEEIISSVLQGKDTLALLPTGGGKSLCYQLPALAKDGLCLVISPLIALMKDQVEALQSKGIRAMAVYSGMSAREIDVALDNAAYGNYKFLYLSPERLETDIFKIRAEKFKVNLIAVDEAHCISEWGYDFRPSYLKIAALPEYYPDVPILALTASATDRVRKDIVEKLEFKRGHQVFSASFDRLNLIYGVVEDEDKKNRLLKLLEKVKGTAIVYTATRQHAKEVAGFLHEKGISAGFYHAGMEQKERAARQEAWKENRLGVIVATNAFGMGIDKADVRLVAHYDMPDSLEAYYQEAGRAGRDGLPAYTIAIVNDHDKLDLKRKPEVFQASQEEIRQVYHALGNYFQIPEGNGLNQSFDFNIGDFGKRFDLKTLKIYSALQELEKLGYLSLSESVFLPSRLKVSVDHHTLYAFEIANKKYEPVIKMILRSYGGCFDEYVNINEYQMAQRLSIPVKEVITMLKELQRLGMLDYHPLKNSPQITYLSERLARTQLHLENAYFIARKKNFQGRIEAVLDYMSVKNACRGKKLLAYFGETASNDCGHCDYCLKSKESPEKAEEQMQKAILANLEEEEKEVSQIARELKLDESDIIPSIRRMLDSGKLGWAGTNLKIKG
jgi:ATP-dependent DNA helicase RecQ